MTPRRAFAALIATVLALAAVVVALVVLDDTQVRAQAPPAGLHVTLVRAAGIDLLLANRVAIGQAPVCATTAASVVCRGTREDGAPIVVDGPATPPAGAPTTVTVTVDGRLLATASAQDVVDGAGSAR